MAGPNKDDREQDSIYKWIAGVSLTAFGVLLAITLYLAGMVHESSASATTTSQILGDIKNNEKQISVNSTRIDNLESLVKEMRNDIKETRDGVRVIRQNTVKD
jgi:septal ring factor EnvC (AmiA/AmiB activator)